MQPTPSGNPLVPWSPGHSGSCALPRGVTRNAAQERGEEKKRSGCPLERSLGPSRPPPYPSGSLMNICPQPLLTFGLLSWRSLRTPQPRPPSGAGSAVPAGRTASPRRGTAGRRGSWHSGRGHWLLSLCPALWPALADLRSSPFSRHDLRRPAAQALYKARTAALIRPRQRADSPPGGSHGAGAGSP